MNTIDARSRCSRNKERIRSRIVKNPQVILQLLLFSLDARGRSQNAETESRKVTIAILNSLFQKFDVVHKKVSIKKERIPIICSLN